MCKGTRKLKIKKNLWFQGVSLLIQVVAKALGTHHCSNLILMYTQMYVGAKFKVQMTAAITPLHTHMRNQIFGVNYCSKSSVHTLCRNFNYTFDLLIANF